MTHSQAKLPWHDPALLRLVPEPYQAELLSYIEHGTWPGAWLGAVLNNNLAGALINSSPLEQAATRSVLIYLYSLDLPEAWGHPDAVRLWAASGGFRGRSTLAAALSTIPEATFDFPASHEELSQ